MIFSLSDAMSKGILKNSSSSTGVLHDGDFSTHALPRYMQCCTGMTLSPASISAQIP
ncbi:predicted protein [Botrytis cinerea T4]|uniref:Uncharacterized protein n=1 Tax=Botryotinia fuckeliana (strain T4) TaxID=999810 RepID=G2Y054_BOTF4|nr:predicted protein [Botrytis cinerea T4]